MAKIAVITGANGQLAQYLIKFLQENEPDIQIVGTLRHKSFDNQEYIFDKSKVIFELMDLSDVSSINQLVIKYKPDYFINTAANAYVGESWRLVYQQMEINCIGVLHQLEAIRKYSPSTRYLQSGTSEEFACIENNGMPQDEKTPLNPRSPYGCAKVASRLLLNVYRDTYKLYAVMNWTFNFESKIRGEKYLTRKVTKGVARIHHALKRGEDFAPIKLGNIYSYRSWQHASDVARGIWMSLNQKDYRKDIKSGELWELHDYVFSESDTHSIKDFVQAAFQEAGIWGYWINQGLQEKFIQENDGKILIEISEEFFRPLDVTYLYGDATKAKEELGWKPKISFKELVKEMVESDIKNYK